MYIYFLVKCTKLWTHRNKVGSESVNVVRFYSDIGVALVHLCYLFIPHQENQRNSYQLRMPSMDFIPLKMILRQIRPLHFFNYKIF